MTRTTQIVIAGANGKMGKELINACANDSSTNIAGAMVRADHPYIDREIELSAPLKNNQVKYTSQNKAFVRETDVIIDFTLPNNTLTLIEQCIKTNVAIVIGTTGFSNEQQKQISEAAKIIPVLQASNMSVGVNVTMALLKQAAKILGNNIPIEITETHHIHKKDSPSGTAITMAETLAKSTGSELDQCLVIDETNPDYQPGHIYVNSIREGEVVGDHCVKFLLEDETIEISHKASDRKIFASGAVRAAKWLAGKAPGMYSIEDVLGIN